MKYYFQDLTQVLVPVYCETYYIIPVPVPVPVPVPETANVNTPLGLHDVILHVITSFCMYIMISLLLMLCLTQLFSIIFIIIHEKLQVKEVC